MEKLIENFKKNWIRIMGKEPTEKNIWFFNRGLEKHIELCKRHEPIIAAERHFDSDDVLLADDEHYPSRTEYKSCQQAFSWGFHVNVKDLKN